MDGGKGEEKVIYWVKNILPITSNPALMSISLKGIVTDVPCLTFHKGLFHQKQSRCLSLWLYSMQSLLDGSSQVKPFFRNQQQVQGIMSRQGMGRTRKHRVPRAKLSNAWLRNQTARRNRTLPQTYQIPFYPRAFAHAVSSLWNAFSLPNFAHTPTLHQGEVSPNPSQPLPPGQVCSFCDSHSRDTPLPLPLDCFSWSATVCSFPSPCQADSSWMARVCVSCLAQNLPHSGRYKAN